MDEAEFGTAGNGMDPFGGELSGGPFRFVEEEPGRPGDIVPDEVRPRYGRGRELSIDELDELGILDDADIGVRLSEGQPIDLSELP